MLLLEAVHHLIRRVWNATQRVGLQILLLSPALCRESTLPQEYIPEISAAVEKAGLKWSQFKVTDNSCPPHPPQESLVQEARFPFCL